MAELACLGVIGTGDARDTRDVVDGLVELGSVDVGDERFEYGAQAARGIGDIREAPLVGLARLGLAGSGLL